MAHGRLHAELRQLRTMLAGPMTDADLLHRFVEKRDEAAFAVLVRRHGSLVLQVCRSVLRQDADADDAFQATFLVLARKAGSFRKGMSLASWLHGVAYRCSMNLRKSAMRRQAREKAAAGGRPSESSPSGAAWNELQACLHEEVQRLPAAVRAAFVLCVLEDKGRAEAARALGCPEGTLASRLAKARKILQKRLTARGMTLSAALSAAAIATGAAPASAALVHETTMAALAFTAGNAAGAVSSQVLTLAQGVLQGMLVTKAKVVAMLMIVVLLGVVAGSSLVAQPSGTDVPAKKVVAPDPVPQAANEKPEARSDKQAHVDSRGDALPEAALVRMGNGRMRHGRSVRASALASDGKTLATAGDSSVIVWDLDSGRELHHFTFDQDFSFYSPGLTFAPDGSHLAYVRNNHFACIWNLRTGKEIHRLELPPDNPSRDDHLTPECRFVNDGKEWMYATRSAVHRIRLDSKRVVESISVPSSPNRVFFLSTDGKTLVHIEIEEVILTEVASGKVLARVGATVRSGDDAVAYSPDGKSFAIVHDQREIQHRELPTGKLLASFPLRNVPTVVGREGVQYHYRPGFSPDGRTLLLGTSWKQSQGVAYRWDLAAGKELPPLNNSWGLVTGTHVLPDGRTIVTTTYDGLIRKWDSATAQPIPEPDSYEGTVSAAFTEDGRFAAVGDRRGRVDLWDARNGKIFHILQHEGAAPAHLAFASDGKSLAVAENSGTVRFWRIPSGEVGAVWERQPAKVGRGSCQGIQFSPDGRLLSISVNPPGIRVVETATGKELWTGTGSFGEGFSSDSSTLIVGAKAGPRLSLLDARTGAKKSSVRFASEVDRLLGFRVKIAASHNGRSMAVIDGGGLSLCDGRTGEEKRRLFHRDTTELTRSTEAERRNKEPLRSIAFSADSHWLASGGEFGRITIWDVAAGEEVLRLPGHEADVIALAFSPDGRTLSSFGQDGQGYRWKLTPKTADGRRPSFVEQWDSLDHAKPADAYRAQWRMIADPKGSVAFLRDRLKPIPPPDAGKVRKWIADLDSEVFAVREVASRELTTIGEAVRTPIREALKKETSPESNRRLKQVLATVSNVPIPDLLRTLRAIMVLERIGSSDARGILESLSRGAPGTQATEEAAAALRRLDEIAVQER